MRLITLWVNTIGHRRKQRYQRNEEAGGKISVLTRRNVPVIAFMLSQAGNLHNQQFTGIIGPRSRGSYAGKRRYLNDLCLPALVIRGTLFSLDSRNRARRLSIINSAPRQSG